MWIGKSQNSDVQIRISFYFYTCVHIPLTSPVFSWQQDNLEKSDQSSMFLSFFLNWNIISLQYVLSQIHYYHYQFPSSSVLSPSFCSSLLFLSDHSRQLQLHKGKEGASGHLVAYWWWKVLSLVCGHSLAGPSHLVLSVESSQVWCMWCDLLHSARCGYSPRNVLSFLHSEAHL